MDKSIILYMEMDDGVINEDSIKVAKIAAVIAVEYQLELHLIIMMDMENLYKSAVNKVLSTLKGIPMDTVYFAYGKLPYSPSKYGKIVNIIRDKIGGDLIVFADTKHNNPIASICATYSGSTLTKDCAGIEIRKDGMIILKIQGPRKLIDKIVTENNTPAIVVIEADDLDESLFENTKHEFKRTKVITKNYTFFAQERKPLSEYKGIIVLGGGVKDKKVIDSVMQFCDAKDYGFACTKSLVNEGKAPLEALIDIQGDIKADCVLAFGVYGDEHFAKFVKNVKRIVSINLDRKAPINKIAHEKIIGDARDIIPVILKND